MMPSRSIRSQSRQWRSLARAALVEDRARADLTTRAALPPGLWVRAVVRAGAAGVVAGLPLMAAVYRAHDPRVRIRLSAREGSRVHPGRVVARIEGPARSVLSGERTALNFLQRLSGIATLTRRCVDRTKGTGAAILHTRKTAPLLRSLDRYAVRQGGGRLHRNDLQSQVLIKENHLSAAGASGPAAVEALVRRVRARTPCGIAVGVEVQDLRILRAVLCAGADLVLFDNLRTAALRRGVNEVRACVRRTGRRILSEASGGISVDDVRAVARAGVDRISIGAVTHSAPALDFSMDIVGRRADRV